jgi:hypothetical protein
VSITGADAGGMVIEAMPVRAGAVVLSYVDGPR